MSELPKVVTVTCRQCGYDRAVHYSANLSDGPLVGKYLLICPTSVFSARGFTEDGMPGSAPYFPKLEGR